MPNTTDYQQYRLCNTDSELAEPEIKESSTYPAINIEVVYIEYYNGDRHYYNDHQDYPLYLPSYQNIFLNFITIGMMLSEYLLGAHDFSDPS